MKVGLWYFPCFSIKHLKRCNDLLLPKHIGSMKRSKEDLKFAFGFEGGKLNISKGGNEDDNRMVDVLDVMGRKEIMEYELSQAKKKLANNTLIFASAAEPDFNPMYP